MADTSMGDLTTREKLELMEALWQELSNNPEELPSPTWHKNVLRKREQRVRDGEESFISWERAKDEIRDRLK